MENQQLSPAERAQQKAFFQAGRLKIEVEDLKPEIQRLEQENLALEALWRQERQARREAERRLERLRGTQGA